MRRAVYLTILFTLASLFLLTGCTGNSDDSSDRQSEKTSKTRLMGEIKKMPRMVDLGSKHCIPCKKMAPILDSLKIAFAGKAEIIFIDIKEDRQSAIDYRIRLIPTQVFFDADSNEVYRHIGFFSADSITAHLEELGAVL